MKSEVKLHNRALDALDFDARNVFDRFVEVIEDLNYLYHRYYVIGEDYGTQKTVCDAMFLLRGVVEDMTA